MELVSLPHFSMIFQENISLDNKVILTDEISLSGCFHFARYYAVCVLQLFVNLFVTS